MRSGELAIRPLAMVPALRRSPVSLLRQVTIMPVTAENFLCRFLLLAWAAAFALSAQPSTAQDEAPAEEVVTLDTRPGVKQSFLLLRPQGEVKGVVLMFPGHEGVVRFVKREDGYDVENDGGGFTARRATRQTYRRHGLVIAVLAPPSDRVRGMDTEFRSSNEHLNDVRQILGYLTKRFGQKPYLHGHCRGSFSPASVTTKLKNDGIAGMILSSARSTGRRGAVMDYERGVVSVPVLLVQHKEDPCYGTPYSNFNAVKDYYAQSSRKVDVILVSGGNLKVSGRNACSSGPHSYSGLERETAGAIANWMLRNEFATSIDGPVTGR